jgi:hypothetical protein
VETASDGSLTHNDSWAPSSDASYLLYGLQTYSIFWLFCSHCNLNHSWTMMCSSDLSPKTLLAAEVTLTSITEGTSSIRLFQGAEMARCLVTS